MEDMTKKSASVSKKEERLLEVIKEIGFGEIKVIINDSKPIRIEELKKSIKL